jgi:hypothetical protein
MTTNNLKNEEKVNMMHRLVVMLPVMKYREIKVVAAVEGITMREFIDIAAGRYIEFLKGRK